MLGGYLFASLQGVLEILLATSAVVAVRLALPSLRTTPNWVDLKFAAVTLVAPWAVVLLIFGFGGVGALAELAFEGRLATLSPLAALAIAGGVGLRVLR